MERYERIKGGEKNLNSGIRWTKKEIIEVYHLYKQLNGVRLHEHNIAIQELAIKLGRTVRSTEAQALMFRNLERFGNYSHGNMNKLSKEVWFEFEQSENSMTAKSEEQLLISFSNSETFDKDEDSSLNYSSWNTCLVNYFFNESFADIEIGCLPVSEELFQEASNYEFSFEDYIHAMKKELSTEKFFSRLETLHKNSIPKEFNGRRIRKPLPDYFGLVVFLIYALTEAEGEKLSVSNVYDRINNFGEEILGPKWSKLDSSIAKNILEPIWESLEDWSCNYLKGKRGLFVRRNHKKHNRKYVSRIERHSLFNSRQFTAILDLIIGDGYRPETNLYREDWINFFKTHINKIPQAPLILDYITDSSPLQSSVIGFLNNYLKQHYTKDSIASESGIKRKPPIRLKLCFKSLPLWPEEPIEKTYFRAFDDLIQKDQIEFKNRLYNINPEHKTLSNIIETPIDLNTGIMLDSKKNRYTSSKRVFWLGKNHELNEWVEVDYQTNDQVFILIGPKELFEKVLLSESIQTNRFIISNTSFIAVRFKNLNEDDFEQVYNLYNPYSKIEGKIELVSEFASDRRRCIYKEFSPMFRYIGPTVNPVVVAVSSEDENELIELVQVESESSKYYMIPPEFEYENSFRLQEKSGMVKTRFQLYYGDLESTPTNVQIPLLKDHYGINQSDFERNEMDILDIPQSFNRDFDIAKFNQWHSELFRLFKGDKDLKFQFDNPKKTEPTVQKGDLLLQYLALNKNITTYDFPKLIRELDDSISIHFSKKVMSYWCNLGYINFQDYGEAIKVNPTSIIFLQSEVGLKGFLTGYRNKDFILDLKKECGRLNIEFNIESHSVYKDQLYPSKVVLYDKRGNLDTFKKLKKTLNIHFVNDIQNPLNTRYVVYQLACLYSQRSVEEFMINLSQEKNYYSDHHRKRIYDSSSLRWLDTNQEVNLMQDGTVIRYDGFRDKSVTHVIRHKGESKIIHDLSLAVFSSLTTNKLMKRSVGKGFQYDILIPFFLALPFWIEKGLVLLNGELPELSSIQGTNYRVYRNINVRILDVIEKKLDQKIIEL